MNVGTKSERPIALNTNNLLIILNKDYSNL